MPYEVRSLETLLAEAKGYFLQAVNGAIIPIWPNTFGVIAKVLAMLGQEHELRRAFLYDQLFIATSSERSLERRGYEFGLIRDPGAPAAGEAAFPAAPGTIVPDGLRFVRGDRTSYRSVGVSTPSGGTVIVSLEAEDIGAKANTAAGAAIRLASESVVPAGLTVSGVVAAGGLVGGLDEESLRDFRKRVGRRRRRPPACGNANDYERWTREAIAHVTQVFVGSFTDEARAVWLQFTVGDQPSGVPSAGQVAVVQAYLDDPRRRPLCARVFVSAPTGSPVNVTIAQLFQDTPEIRAAILADLQATFAEQVAAGAPGAPFLLRRTVVGAAISRVVGEAGYTLIDPAANITFPTGVLPTLGDVTYV